MRTELLARKEIVESVDRNSVLVPYADSYRTRTVVREADLAAKMATIAAPVNLEAEVDDHNDITLRWLRPDTMQTVFFRM